ncbi:MAG: HAMP domain-containing sensor histidine kinase [Thermoanaerobaculia bacterium]
MRRLRILFLLLAVVLLVPMALVVRRAFRSIEAERTMFHRNVADRIADEMERELSTWLRREEDRPFDQYRFFYVPEGTPTDIVSLRRSPLSESPPDPFVICYFQIEPDGTISSPLWPGNEDLARASGWQESDEVREIAELVGQVIGDFWHSEGSPAGRSEALEAKDGSATRQNQLADIGLKKRGLADPGAAAEQTKEAALQSLNRGARERRQRPAKVAPSQAANVYNFSLDESNAVQSSIRSRDLETDADGGDGRAEGELWTTTREVREGIEEALAAKASGTIDVRLEPMVGRPATTHHLILYRIVSIGEKAYRQGLVLDTAQLVEWLRDRVLTDSELAAYSRIGAPRTSGPLAEASYTFPHRFAEPFGAVTTDISLATLPGSDGGTDIVTLSLLLAAATTLGLFALYRMVAVRVAYAERRGNFVSSVTHELKTPLTAIRMYAEMLRDGVVADAASRQRYYEIMTAESERLGRLVQNVLELSQLEQNQRSVRLAAGDVGAVLKDVVGVLGPHADQQGFTIRLEVEPDLPRVRFDRDALLQVLFNLVDNAIKYARGAEDKEILLSCRCQGAGVVLAVADHGPGVARRHLEKIFEPFYRGEDELTRTSKGTGIGLALVQGLVEQMGGAVDGRNVRGGGFEVAISLAA